MSFYYSDDPGRDADRYDMELERRRARRPICERCGEHIQDEELWNINGKLYCQECAEIEFREPTDIYTEE